MNTWIIAACIAFAISFAIMLYYSKVFWFKIATITLLFVIANMMYFSFDTIKGWPSGQKIAKGELVFVDILEPSETYSGAIYLYVREDNSESHWYDKFVKYVYWDSNAPRSYYIPYTKRASKQMREAQEAMKKGYIVEITGDSADAQGNDEEQTEANNGGSSDPRQDGSDEVYKVPHFELIDPRTRNGKVSQQ